MVHGPFTCRKSRNSSLFAGPNNYGEEEESPTGQVTSREEEESLTTQDSPGEVEEEEFIVSEVDSGEEDYDRTGAVSKREAIFQYSSQISSLQPSVNRSSFPYFCCHSTKPPSSTYTS